MPERVLALSQQVSSVATEKVGEIRRIIRGTKILALNSAIEAARAGEAGVGFTIVSREIGEVSAKIEKLAAELDRQLSDKTEELGTLGRGLVASVRGTRLADLALNMIDIIDRNLYERSCDVRWWATDSAVVDCVAVPGMGSAAHAASRLGVILDSYTVYLDLWIADAQGCVLANGRPRQYASARGLRVEREAWFRRAMESRDGTEFTACDIARNPGLNNAQVATYSAAIREGGRSDGRILGVLGIFFDWEKQSQAVVDGVRLSAEERALTRCLILDSGHRVIAASDRGGMFETCRIETGGQPMGTYEDQAGKIVGFALTPGYETYRGLGWYGVLMRARKP
jgi:hypothetical protein